MSSRFNHVVKSTLQSPIGNRIAFFLFAAMIGMVVGLATVALIELISVVQWIGYGERSEARFAEIAASTPTWRVVLTPLLGGLVVGITLHMLPGRRYHGIADVMEACAFNSGRMGARSGIGAAFAASVSLGVGAPLGREGPAVHIGASISAWFAEKLNLNRSQSLALLGCGAAAAVTTSFNAPIAGVLFALEVIVGYYTLRVFAPVVVASLLAVVVRHQFYGSDPMYELPNYSINTLWELPLFAVLGICGALLVALFILLVSVVDRSWQSTRVSTWLRPAVAGLIIGLFATRYPMILSVGFEPVVQTLNGLLQVKEIATLLLLKTAGAAIALGSGFAGGVFSPSVFIGTMLGGVYCYVLGSIGMNSISEQGVYSIVGMAAVASAMLGAPISTVLIVFEVTRSYDVTMAVMIAAAFASTVMQLGENSSFFRWQLNRRGVNISSGRDVSLLMTHTVEKLITRRYSVASADMTLNDIESQLGRERQRVVIIVDEDQQYVDSLDLRGIVVQSIENGRDTLLSEVLNDTAVSVSPDINVVAALQRMAEAELDYLPIVGDVKGEQSNVLGVIFRSDLMTEHYEVLKKAREDEFGVA